MLTPKAPKNTVVFSAVSYTFTLNLTPDNPRIFLRSSVIRIYYKFTEIM